MIDPSHIDSAQILAFLAVAEQGSFSLAAHALHITQPAVSKRIAQLESQVGAPLFDRLVRRVELTEWGERLMPAALQYRQALEEIASTSLGTGQELTGRLRIALSHYAGLHVLPDALSRFSEQYPGVLLDLRFVNSEEALTAVAQGNVMLAYGTLGDTAHPVTQKPLWEERMQPMVARRHVDTATPNLTDLLRLAGRLPAILPAAHTTTRQTIDRWLHQAGIAPLAVIEVNQLDSIALLVGTGIGWSVLPETLYQAGLALIAPGDGPPPPERRLGLIVHRDRLLSRAALAFMACAQARRSPSDAQAIR